MFLHNFYIGTSVLFSQTKFQLYMLSNWSLRYIKSWKRNCYRKPKTENRHSERTFDAEKYIIMYLLYANVYRLVVDTHIHTAVRD